MATYNWTDASITSWDGGFCQELLDGIAPLDFTLDIQAPVEDITPLGYKSQKVARGNVDWSVSINATYDTPRFGIAGTLGYDAGDVTRIESYDLTIEYASHRITKLGQADYYNRYAFEAPRITGSFTAIQDDAASNKIQLPPDAEALATFTLWSDGSGSRLIACPILPESASLTIAQQQENRTTYNFQSSATSPSSLIVVSGSGSTDDPFPVDGGSGSETLYESIVAQTLTAETGAGTIIGDCFPTSISITTSADQIARVVVNATGTSALTGTAFG